MIWVWLVWAAALVVIVIVAWMLRPRNTADTTGANTANDAITTVTDFKCSIAPGPLSSPPLLQQRAPGALTVSWGAATLESRGINYTVTLSGPTVDPPTATTAGLSVVFSGLPAGSTWTATVLATSRCGNNTAATSGSATVCSGPPTPASTFVGQPGSGTVAWAAVPGASSYSIVISDGSGIIKAVAGIPCTTALCGYSYNTASSNVTITVRPVGACGYS